MTTPEPQIEIVCNRCGHRMARSPERLRRDTPVLCPACGAEVAPGDPTRKPDG